jgi:hypothetical protein
MVRRKVAAHDMTAQRFEGNRMPLEGLDRALQQLQAIGAGLREGAAQALTEEAQRVKVRSQELVPVAPRPGGGKLRDSARTKVEEDGDRIVAEISYGGPDAPYAAKVHEDVAAHHEHGQAKFLEQAANEARAGMSERMGQVVTEAIKRRLG